MNKFKVGDQIIFKYQYNYRVGFINAFQEVKDLKKRKHFVYFIKDLAKDIAIKESNILNTIEPIKPKPYRIRIVQGV